MRRPLSLRFVFIFIFLAACSSQPVSYENYYQQKKITLPHESELQECRGYGCRFKDSVILDKVDWKQIRKNFSRKIKTPEDERRAVAAAIGDFEKIVGKKTGTEFDLAGTFQSTGNFQHDCVDESINTTTYLVVLKQAGLLRFHDILQPNARLWSGWPHQTAVIMEIDAGGKYAVDSWFHDNGVAAEVVPIELWEGGWSPAQHG